jgi:drug/metabolite transporter (DMT)-like permease
VLWFFLSLTAALSQAVNDVLSKRFFSDLTAYEMGLTRLLYAVPYLLIGFFFIPRPPLDNVFWLCLAAGLPLESVAFLCYMRAIKVSPLSLTVPFLAFTPAFVIVTGFLILGETLSSYGIAGIILIVVGSYLLNASHLKHEWFAPIKEIFREQGSWLMLLTSLLYSLTATIGKLAIEHSSARYFAVTYFLFFTILMAFMLPLAPGTKAAHIFKRPLPAGIAGVVLAIMIFSHTYAISLIEAAYMLSVKRSSLLFGVLFGAVCFKETHFKERLFGASMMMFGVLVIGLLG